MTKAVSSPRISFILSTRNRCAQAKGVIDLMLAEKERYPNLELIVVDGASTDRTVDMLRTYGERIDRWVSKKDSSVYEAYNTGLKLATGDYVRILADDDEYFDQRLVEVGAYCITHPGCIIAAGCDYVSFRGHKRATHVSECVTMMDLQYFLEWPFFKGFFHESIFFPRAVLERCGGWNEQFHIAADVELIIRLLKCAVPMALLPFTIMRRVVRAESVSSRHAMRGHLECLWILLRHGYAFATIQFVVGTVILLIARMLKLRVQVGT